VNAKTLKAIKVYAFSPRENSVPVPESSFAIWRDRRWVTPRQEEIGPDGRRYFWIGGSFSILGSDNLGNGVETWIYIQE